MAIVTITGEYGTGSRELIIHLANKTGFDYIGKELQKEIAKELKLSESEVEMFRKASQSRLIRKLDRYTCALVQKVVDRQHGCLDDHDFHEANTKLVEKLHATDDVIIHNWGAQCILKGWPNCVHVRLTRDREKKIKLVQDDSHLSFSAARRLVLDEERDMEAYLKQYFNADWNDTRLYDLTIDMDQIPVPKAAEMITDQLQHKITP